MDSVGINVNGHLRIRRHWKSATNDYWDDLWDHTASKEYWRNAMIGLLPADVDDVISRYISKGAKILEAGCGIGHVVIALRRHGYDCYGLDCAERTINVLEGHFPEVPFTHGDIRNLPYESEFFDAYISLGVIYRIFYRRAGTNAGRSGPGIEAWRKDIVISSCSKCLPLMAI